jgi:hypothetical protein
MEANQRGGWRRLSIIRIPISPGTCSPQHPICAVSRRIRHTICFRSGPKTRTSSLHKSPDPMECDNRNTWNDGVLPVQEGSLGNESHLYLSCPCVSTLADTLIVEFRARLPWDAYTKHQQMAVLLKTMSHGLRVNQHKQWILTILPQCHALAAKLTITV